MRRFLAVAAGIVLSGLTISTAWATSILDASLGSFNFGADDGSAQTLEIGERAAAGFTVRYDNVITVGGVNIDAVATVIDITNLDSDDDQTSANNLVDQFDNSSSTGEEIDLDIDIFGDGSIPQSQTGSVTFRIDFVEDNSTNAVIVENVGVVVKDIDKKQFVEFAGITAYELSASPATEIDVSDSGGLYTFFEPDSNGSSSDDEENWVVAEWAEISSLTIVAGANEAGGASFDISFVDTSWTSAPTRQTINLTAYDLAYDSNNADSGSVPGTQSSTSGSSIVTLSAPQGDLVRSGFTFGGWNTRSDGSGANYVTGDRIALGSDSTLFARWIPISVDSDSDSELEPAENAAIHLDIQTEIGSSAVDASILHEGEGLVRNTPYTLRLGPSGELLGSGVVDQFGYFSETVQLPNGLPPGAYAVTLSTTDPAGMPLSLTQTFTVGAGGLFTGLGSTVPVLSGQALAATGAPSGFLMWAGSSVVFLTSLGAALLLLNSRLVRRARAL